MQTKNLLFTRHNLLFLGPFFLINLILFTSSYFDIDIYTQEYFLFWNLAVALVLSFFLHEKLFGKIVFILASTIASTFIGVVLLLATMILPGSLEHNHIMYDVCLPAMREKYGIGPDEPFPSGGEDQQGWGKWWFQHLECEENVRNGKGPVFSENPPGYEPTQKTEDVTNPSL